MDHTTPRWLRSFKEPKGHLTRWLETQESFDYDLQHWPGVKHSNVDILSRDT